MGCDQTHCGACCGGSCGGCGGELRLTQAELDILMRFAQIPFFPVARRADSDRPVCLEFDSYPADVLSGVLTALWDKRLIRLDYDLPLTNFDYGAYRDYPIQGSMALTAAGQGAVELLEIQGIEA